MDHDNCCLFRPSFRPSLRTFVLPFVSLLVCVCYFVCPFVFLRLCFVVRFFVYSLVSSFMGLFLCLFAVRLFVRSRLFLCTLYVVFVYTSVGRSFVRSSGRFVSRSFRARPHVYVYARKRTSF